MNVMNRRPWLWLGVAAIVGGVIGALMKATERFGDIGPLVLMVAALVASVWIMRIYWRALDEAAKEAQKHAWLWGGSFGLAVALVLVLLAARDVLGFGLLLPADAEPGRALIRGATITAGGQMAGFALAWALWWWRRR